MDPSVAASKLPDATLKIEENNIAITTRFQTADGKLKEQSYTSDQWLQKGDAGALIDMTPAGSPDPFFMKFVDGKALFGPFVKQETEQGPCKKGDAIAQVYVRQ